MDLVSRKIFVSKDVKFHETRFPFSTQWSCPTSFPLFNATDLIPNSPSMTPFLLLFGTLNPTEPHSSLPPSPSLPSTIAHIFGPTPVRKSD